MRLSVRATIVSLVMALGLFQLGAGAYIPAKAWLAQELMQRAWTRSGFGEQRARPWPWADTWPVARLTARQDSVALIVLAGGSGRTLAFAPGHMSGSAEPGDIGNTIIAGHRDTHFAFLENLELGEMLDLETPDGLRFGYEIVDVEIVDSRSATLTPDADSAMLSLVTCYPFDAAEAGGPLRYVVTAARRY